ncbi:MAG: response regulator [Gammaproteobacteria bacterium]|nr:MAG: response regulator [Gammaproteobacteria bacterium]
MDMFTKILSVDDNAQNRKVIELALKDCFDVVSSDGNEPFLALVSTEQPKIILLDIMLENKSGFDLCKQLRDSDENNNIIVIFVSALSSLDDKLTAYACGADDYICKPINVVELCEKLKVVELRINEKNQLTEQCKQASQVAFTSMKNASELGLLINFFTDSLRVFSTDELFEKITDFFTQFELGFSLEFRIEQAHVQYPKDIISTLEIEILELGRTAQRIVSFGNNILFNSPWCSILVKHIPMEDESLIGRLRDHFAILLSIIDSRLMFIDSENKRVKERTLALESLSQALSSNFNEIKQGILDQESALLTLVSELTTNMDQKTITMGLSEDQEADLVGLFEDTKEKFVEVIGSSVQIDNKLRNINRLLLNVN